MAAANRAGLCCATAPGDLSGGTGLIALRILRAPDIRRSRAHAHRKPGTASAGAPEIQQSRNRCVAPPLREASGRLNYSAPAPSRAATTRNRLPLTSGQVTIASLYAIFFGIIFYILQPNLIDAIDCVVMVVGGAAVVAAPIKPRHIKRMRRNALSACQISARPE